jgi:transcriptional antiterminator
MEFIKLKAYVEELDQLIQEGNTGTAKEFAKKLGISERSLHYHLKELNILGAEIIYEPYKRTYKYAKRGHLFFGFTDE